LIICGVFFITFDRYFLPFIKIIAAHPPFPGFLRQEPSV